LPSKALISTSNVLADALAAETASPASPISGRLLIRKSERDSAFAAQITMSYLIFQLNKKSHEGT
jgi:hypothetical protein